MSSFSDLVISASPLLYLQMKEITGQVLADSSGNGRNGTISGAYAMGKPTMSSGTDGAIKFSGGRVVVPAAAALVPSGDYSIEAVLNFGGPTLSPIVNMFDPGTPYAGPGIYGNYEGPARGVVAGSIAFCDGQDTGSYSAKFAGALNDNVYRHYVFCRRGTSLEIWINGDLKAQVTMPSVRTMNTPQPMYIMAAASGTPTTIGDADELVYYETALSPDRIRLHAANAANKKRVVGSAKLDNGAAASSVIAYDWTTRALLAQTVPATDGSFELIVPDGNVAVTTTGPAGYQPITHGPVVPVALV